MLSMLENWKGAVEIDGIQYNNIQAFVASGNKLSGEISIKLLPAVKAVVVDDSRSDSKQNIEKLSTEKEYRITVKQYMTKPSEPGFDFMSKWNNNHPMPLRTMIGTELEETRGMIKMKLRGFGEATCNCMRCGRNLTNKISRFYGIGPECMSKLGLVRDIEDVEGIKEDLVKIEWEGWIIKSAITSKEEV